MQFNVDRVFYKIDFSSNKQTKPTSVHCKQNGTPQLCFLQIIAKKYIYMYFTLLSNSEMSDKKKAYFRWFEVNSCSNYKSEQC